MFACGLFRSNEEEKGADCRFAGTVALKFTVQLYKQAARFFNVRETAVRKRDAVIEVGWPQSLTGKQAVENLFPVETVDQAQCLGSLFKDSFFTAGRDSEQHIVWF